MQFSFGLGLCVNGISWDNQICCSFNLQTCDKIFTSYDWNSQDYYLLTYPHKRTVFGKHKENLEMTSDNP